MFKDDLQEFVDAVNKFDGAISKYAATKPDPKEAAEFLNEFEQFRLQQFRLVQQNLFNVVLDVMEQDSEFVFGDRVVKKGWTTKKRAWRHEELVRDVLQRAKDLSMNDDGEVTLTPRQAVDAVYGCCHIDNWRKKDLAKFDLSPDSYVDLGETDPVVTVGKVQ